MVMMEEGHQAIKAAEFELQHAEDTSFRPDLIPLVLSDRWRFQVYGLRVGLFTVLRMTKR